MSAKDNGGPAYPVMACAHESGLIEYHKSGMTLRDYFATHASRQDVEAQAEVIRTQILKENGSGVLPDGWQVKARYMHADAMLEARK